ncbi:hypothetical protein HYPSUDRAFT_45571 [Hypholoma sublateritium FD-334 SS-4]|uniref:Uncharacterized protein n=1 Tax=Hypholoma sublateritium (strain FD-334 SS-4) TaxID=945553 RepID=A0A0D2KU45_HYPSF|nr:hypothetical protein HYPSUDRAFT_45571 [Hypholoma sublateritium FD-334 SS-4]
MFEHFGALRLPPADSAFHPRSSTMTRFAFTPASSPRATPPPNIGFDVSTPMTPMLPYPDTHCCP